MKDLSRGFFLLTVLITSFACSASEASAATAPPEPPAPPPAVAAPALAIAPERETVRAISELTIIAWPWDRSTPSGPDAAWEIRDADLKTRIARIPVPKPPENSFVGRFEMKSFSLQWSLTPVLRSLPDGLYHLAWCEGDRRISNVMAFRLDKDSYGRKLPLLALTEIEPMPGWKAPMLLLRAYRHAAADPSPKLLDIQRAGLNIDGKEHQYLTGPLVAHGRGLDIMRPYTRIVDLTKYNPSVEPGDKPHVVFAKVGDVTSEPITVAGAHPMADAWDGGGGTTAPASARSGLFAVLTGLDGKPGAGYNVRASNNDFKTFEVKADAEGRCLLPAASEGKWWMTVAPKETGRPFLKTEVDVREGTGVPTTLNVSLERKSRFSGRVTAAGGAPAAGCVVVGVWVTAGGKDYFEDAVVTDADGRYTLGAPYPEAQYVEAAAPAAGRGPRLRDVKAGRTDVDFVLTKP